MASEPASKRFVAIAVTLGTLVAWTLSNLLNLQSLVRSQEDLTFFDAYMVYPGEGISYQDVSGVSEGRRVIRSGDYEVRLKVHNNSGRDSSIVNIDIETEYFEDDLAVSNSLQRIVVDGAQEYDPRDFALSIPADKTVQISLFLDATFRIQPIRCEGFEPVLNRKLSTGQDVASEVLRCAPYKMGGRGVAGRRDPELAFTFKTARENSYKHNARFDW